MESGEVKKKVLLLPKWYPNRVEPQNGNFIENHAIAISKQEDIGVLCVMSEDRTSGDMYDVLIDREKGFPVVRVYFKKPLPLFNFLTAYRYWRAQRIGYRKIVSLTGTPDLCHIHVMARTGFLALYLKYIKRIPYLVTEHWSGYTRENAKFGGLARKILTRFLVKKAEKITVVSEYLRNAMLDHGLNGDYIFIPNVADTLLFHPRTAERKAANASKKQLIHISTLDERAKNLPGLLRVIAKIRRNRNDFHLHIFGDGPERASREHLAEELGLSGETVTFYGEVEPEQVAKQLSISCSLVLFSNYETQSVVMIESFCCGVPVIATRVGGIPEHLDENRGLLADPKNELTLEKCIMEMLECYGSYDTEKIREYALANFSDEYVGKKFSQLYNNTGN